MLLHLDMDGVLCDFISGICAAHNVTSPYLVDPLSRGVWDIDLLLGMPLDEFWAPCEYDFWRNLPKTPEADEIVKLLTDTFGAGNITPLTSPSKNEGCITGKLDWLEEHYPALSETVIFEKQKHIYAGPGKLLIDDNDRNCREWIAAGGEAFLFPRLWNSRHHEAGVIGMRSLREWVEQRKMWAISEQIRQMLWRGVK